MKKSLYVLLTAILGVFLFFILHRLAFFFWALICSMDENLALNYYSLPALVTEYVTLLLAIFGGAWYGIWLGLFWYDKVYVEGTHPGWVAHFSNKIWPAPGANAGTVSKLRHVTKKLEQDLMHLEDLALAQPSVSSSGPAPIKRTLVRKRAPKKISKTK